MTNEIRLCCQPYHQITSPAVFTPPPFLARSPADRPSPATPPSAVHGAQNTTRRARCSGSQAPDPGEFLAFFSPKPLYDFRNYYDYRHGVGSFRLLPHSEKVTHLPRVTLLNALEHIFPKKLPTSCAQIQFSPAPTTTKNGPKRLPALFPILFQFSSPADFTPTSVGANPEVANRVQRPEMTPARTAIRTTARRSPPPQTEAPPSPSPRRWPPPPGRRFPGERAAPPSPFGSPQMAR